MRIDEILTEEQLNELNWRKGLATAAMAAGAMGALGTAQARVGPDHDPSINRLTGKPIATQQADKSGGMTIDQAKKDPRYGVDADFTQEVDKAEQFANGFKGQGAQMPNQSLDAADKVERTTDGVTVHYAGKAYKGVVVPKDSPTPRGAKMIKIQQAQMGERGIGNYTTYLLPNGTAYIYR